MTSFLKGIWVGGEWLEREVVYLGFGLELRHCVEEGEEELVHVGVSWGDEVADEGVVVDGG